MPEASAQEPSLPHVPATVADIMRPPLTTVQPNDHVAAAAYLMRREAATALVVLDARPIGRWVWSPRLTLSSWWRKMEETRIRYGSTP